MTAVYDRIKESFDKQNFLRLLGVKLESAEKGEVVLSCQRKDDLTQQHGFLHAGVLSTLADAACGFVALSVMPEGNEVLSVEFKLNLLRPAVAPKFIVRGYVIKAGRKIIVTEAEVKDADSGKLISKMTGTMTPAPIEAEKSKDKPAPQLCRQR